MAMIAFLLFLLLPIPALLLLVKPEIINRRLKKGKLSRKNILAIFIISEIIFLLLAALLITPPSGKKNEEFAPKLTVKQEENQEESKDLVKVTRIIDGDTIEIEGGQRIRYIGINSPELSSFDETIGCYAREATDKNKALVLDKKVRLEKDVSETDKYDRLLRYVWVNDIFVNDYLAREGFAQAVSYPPDIKYQDQFLEAQKEARENNRGLWSACDAVLLPPTTQ